MKIESRVQRVRIKSRRIARDDDERAFLTLYRFEVENHYRDGLKSVVYNYDGVLRKWIDAVVVGLTSRIGGSLSVCLRACIRPPLLLRDDISVGADDLPAGMLWEMPAGLLEEGEGDPKGVRRRAAIEAFEETGYSIDESDFTVLSGAPFLSPGVMPERVHFVWGRISDIADKAVPTGDGSPAEDDEGIWWVPLEQALEMCYRGEIADAKTEIFLHRLSQRMVGVETA